MPDYASKPGVTLAELLLVLALSGILAAFAVPKVLQGSQQSKKFTAIAKESARGLAAAYRAMALGNEIPATTTQEDVIPYLNYITFDTTSSFDLRQTLGTASCGDATRYCYRLHNGALLTFQPGEFGGTSATNALTFQLDPDGKVTDGTTNGPGKSTQLLLYYDGKVRPRGQAKVGTRSTILGTVYTLNPNVSHDPSWLSWD